MDKSRNREMSLQLTKDLLMTCAYVKELFKYYPKTRPRFGMTDDELMQTIRGAIVYTNLVDEILE